MPKTKLDILSAMFQLHGTKTVSSTDKTKGAYVVNASQLDVFNGTGMTPTPHGTRPAPIFDVKVLFNPIKSVEASYYSADRVTDPSRTPEIRMGHGFISSWLNIGDELFLGTDGYNIFACKLDQNIYDDDEAENLKETVLDRVDDQYIETAVVNAPQIPTQSTRITTAFVRSPEIVQKAKRRSSYACDMPGCGRPGFLKPDGAPYIEVHHIVPLSEGGYDTMDNVAALCPTCHRMQHFSEDMNQLRSNLLDEIRRKY